MSAVRIPVPVGHVAHWKVTDEGKVEVEMLRFLTPHEAWVRTGQQFKRRVAA